MNAVDLFAGCGGMSLGFTKAGVNILSAYDYWEPAVECYRTNFAHPIFRRDLSDVASVIEIIDPLMPQMVVGGPPCQDFSHAGPRTEGNRADLTVNFAEIVSALRSQWFVMENVNRIEKSGAYMKARNMFRAAGYGLTEVLLDASLCGVPQKRKRFFCIGRLDEQDGFLRDDLMAALDVEPMTVRRYMGEELRIEHFYRHPRNYSRRAVFSIDEPAPTVRGVNRPVPSGYPGHGGDSAPVSSGIRSLTTEERARLQTFPPEFEWSGTKTDKEQLIGNAVPVELAAFVGKAVMAYHKSATPTPAGSPV